MMSIVVSSVCENLTAFILTSDKRKRPRNLSRTYVAVMSVVNRFHPISKTPLESPWFRMLDLPWSTPHMGDIKFLGICLYVARGCNWECNQQPCDLADKVWQSWPAASTQWILPPVWRKWPTHCMTLSKSTRSKAWDSNQVVLRRASNLLSLLSKSLINFGFNLLRQLCQTLVSPSAKQRPSQG